MSNEESANLYNPEVLFEAQIYHKLGPHFKQYTAYVPKSGIVLDHKELSVEEKKIKEEFERVERERQDAIQATDYKKQSDIRSIKDEVYRNSLTMLKLSNVLRSSSISDVRKDLINQEITRLKTIDVKEVFSLKHKLRIIINEDAKYDDIIDIISSGKIKKLHLIKMLIEKNARLEEIEEEIQRICKLIEKNNGFTIVEYKL